MKLHSLILTHLDNGCFFNAVGEAMGLGFGVSYSHDYMVDYRQRSLYLPKEEYGRCIQSVHLQLSGSKRKKLFKSWLVHLILTEHRMLILADFGNRPGILV